MRFRTLRSFVSRDFLGPVMATLALGLVQQVALAADKSESHPFGVRDLVAFDRISDPRVSPDGRWVAFSVSALDLGANRRRSDLWLVGVDGTGLRRLTSHEASDTSPRWMPDGKSLCFLSSRSGSSQVWSLALDGGEAQPVTKLPLDVGGFALSRDGALLAVSLEVFVDCSDLECTQERLAAQEKSQASGRLYDNLLFRHWDTWSDGRRSHLFVVPSRGSGKPVDVMKKMDAHAPSRPFGGDEEFVFTPDGRGVVFTAKDAGREEAWSTNYDLWLASVDGNSPPRKLTTNLATDTTPLFSPDGKTLAYLAMARPGYEADRLRLMLRTGVDGSERVLAESWDRSIGSFVWSADGRELFVSAEHLGQEPLFALDATTGAVRTLVEQGTVRSPQTAGDRIVYGLDHLQSPVELHAISARGGTPLRLTDMNHDRLAAVRMGAPEQFTFEGANGETVHAYLVKPVDFDAKKKYPVAFLIHGGPQGSMANDFHYRWNPQAYAGAGYAAIMVDFHGSTGYGQAFCDAIRGDWGGKPLEDLQKGLAAALQKYSFLDGDKVAALGASYGGFMINWIAGAWPDRFRCLVSHDGNLDERGAYFMTEELWFPEWDHLGTPWENPASYEKHNPLALVQQWQTPILVIHGGKDYRVVETEGMATFTAAQRRGIPSKFLHFPDENHWVLKPHNSILWHDTVLAWLDEWTKGKSKKKT